MSYNFEYVPVQPFNFGELIYPRTGAEAKSLFAKLISYQMNKFIITLNYIMTSVVLVAIALLDVYS